MPVITHLGDGGILWIALAVLLLCLPKYRKTGVAMGFALLMGLLICNLWLKPWIGRLRPFEYVQQNLDRVIPLLIDAPKDFSFPSGHTAVAFAGAVALYAAGKKWMRIGLVYACCMGFCRMYLLMHYPTDVLFGALCGAACGLAALYLCKRVEAALLHRRKAL